jgi:hypothetical protein
MGFESCIYFGRFPLISKEESFTLIYADQICADLRKKSSPICEKNFKGRMIFFKEFLANFRRRRFHADFR